MDNIIYAITMSALVAVTTVEVVFNTYSLANGKFLWYIWPYCHNLHQYGTTFNYSADIMLALSSRTMIVMQAHSQLSIIHVEYWA